MLNGKIHANDASDSIYFFTKEEKKKEGKKRAQDHSC